MACTGPAADAWRRREMTGLGSLGGRSLKDGPGVAEGRGVCSSHPVLPFASF